MKGCPMLIVTDNPGDGETVPTILDTYSVAKTIPTENDENIYILTKSVATEHGWELDIQRPIVFEREGRVETIFDKQNTVMNFAYHEGDGYPEEHTRHEYGFFSMKMDVNKQSVSIGTRHRPKDVFYKTHGILFYIAWSIMTFALIASGRYMKHLYNFRMILHVGLGLLITANTIILVLFSWIKFDSSKDLLAHKPIGIAVMFISFAQCSGGFAVKTSMTTLNWRSKLTLNSKLGHQLFGYALIILSNFQVVSGLYRYKSPITKLIYIHLAVFVVMLFALEIFYRMRFRYTKKGVLNKRVQNYSYNEYRKMLSSGRKLALFNDYILDISSFINEHPGGAFVMRATVGSNMGKYFYGGSSMETDVPPYKHSSYAGRILEKLTIGKLENKYLSEDNSNRSRRDFSIRSGNPSVKVEMLRDGCNIFTIKKKVWLTSTVSRISFHCIDTSIPSIYEGLEMCGKNYSITSMKNDVTRYYTICNSMGSQIFEEYMKSFGAAIEETEYQRRFEGIADFNKEEKDILELVIKHYPKSDSGISKQVFNASHHEEFYIEGPISVDFGYTEENLEGANIIFCGGTGILPFMDLFAYLGRRLVATSCPDYSIFSDEVISTKESKAKFLIHAYFQTREDCIGIELVERIEKLYQKYNKGALFKLNLILTNRGGEKLSDDDIVELMEDYSVANGGLNKLLVCGPPPMDMQFHKLKGRIMKKTNLDLSQIDIL
uniref:Cytochrome b5 heme-binding domain-containing protein n=1 Tax=Euplotes crassus TaxID=5936 RepID=A0A7S3KIP2_EUPCR